MSFVVMGISENISSTVRNEMVSPQYRSLPAFTSVANGYGPCRSCLRTFDQGEEDRTSFTYNPVDGILDLPQPGPVFIHSEECDRFVDSSFPQGIRGLPMYFESFDRDGMMRSRVLVTEGSEDEQIVSLLSEETVDFLHVRNAEAGCFIARIERVD